MSFQKHPRGLRLALIGGAVLCFSLMLRSVPAEEAQARMVPAQTDAAATATVSDTPPPGMPEPRKMYDFTFPGAVRIGDQWIPRQGETLLRYWGFKVYVIALYGPAESTVEEIQTDAPKRLWIHYLRDIERDVLIKSAGECLEWNPENDMEAMAPQIEKINRMYVDVEKGDDYSLTYDPKTESTTLEYNGKVLGTVEGRDLARAYFGIWLSEYPLNEDVKDALLDGLPRSADQD